MVLLDRWIEIIDYLKEKKYGTVEELMDKFGLSRSTLRRTLISMEDRNLVKRVRGGVEIIEDGSESVAHYLEAVFNSKVLEKKVIAEIAASKIKDNDIIFIDSGSTCYHMIDFIKAKNITVVTNGIVHIQKLMSKGINTYILGGYAKPDQNLITGEDMANKISLMNFDKAFLGTLGIDAKAGFTTTFLADGEVKRAVIKSAEVCYILADTSKFNKRNFYTYGGFEQATIITNDRIAFEVEGMKIVFPKN